MQAIILYLHTSLTSRMEPKGQNIFSESSHVAYQIKWNEIYKHMQANILSGGTSFVDLLCFCSVVCLLCLCARLFICAFWSPAGKGMTSLLSFLVSPCEFVTFLLVSWVWCGT